MGLDGAERAVLVDLVNVKAGHSLCGLVDQRCARGANRLDRSRWCTDGATAASVQVAVEDQPAAQAREGCDLSVCVVETPENAGQSGSRIVDGVMLQDDCQSRRDLRVGEDLSQGGDLRAPQSLRTR